jgi:hypothetical protein
MEKIMAKIDYNEIPLAEIFEAENGYLIIDANEKTHVALKLDDITKTIEKILQAKERKKLLEREMPVEYIDDPLVDED